MADRPVRSRVLVCLDRCRDPTANLAREDEVFERVEKGDLPEVVRLWENRECLVKGRVRNFRYGWYDKKLAEKMGVPVFERSTGGGVVYHDLGNLNWSFFLRVSGAFLSPKAAFDMASRHVVEALARLGVPAIFSPPNRIEVEGRKVSGMAAKSVINTLLVHGTLLLRSDLETLNSLCLPAHGSPPVANLCEWVPDIDRESVVGALVSILRDTGRKVELATADRSKTLNIASPTKQSPF